MRKRIFSIMLCCVMLVGGVMPTTAFATGGSINYGFTINGTEVTSENIGRIPGVTGTVSYDQSNKTLTLDGVTITSSNRRAIDCRDGVAAIKLVGANEILFTADAAVATADPIYGILFESDSNELLTISGSSRSDSLKITVPKEINYTENRYHGGNCIYAKNNLEIRSCTLDVLRQEVPYPEHYPSTIFSRLGDITVIDCELKAVLGKNRSGEINKAHRGYAVFTEMGDITVTKSKVEASVFSSEGGEIAVIDGKNITITDCELDLEVQAVSEGDVSIRALHIANIKGKINLTNCFGTIEVSSSKACKCFGIDIWPGAEEECLTIDGCTLTINTLGVGVNLREQQAILIKGDSDAATKKWLIFQKISKFTYGDTAASAEMKAFGSTETGFWRKHYLKITAAPTELKLDQSTLELVSGNRQTLTATVTPAHAEQNVTWISDNESVATVADGVVTAVSAGTATITASASGLSASTSDLSASCTVTVKDPVYSVSLNTNGGTINSDNVTEYTYGVGATLPTAVTRTGYTFDGWYNNENLTGSPVTAISNTETGNKEYWAKWEINQYTVTVKPENGEADITITQDYGTPITAPTLTREGYQFTGWDKTFPTTMPAEDMTITAQWLDVAAPTGEIKIGENDWKTFLNNITFGLFFKDTQSVTITAADNSGYTVTIEYLLSDKELTQAELAGMTFTVYSAPFNINPDNEYVIYAKMTDASSNVAYINTDGIVLDATTPVISGIEDGKTYYAAQTVTVDEKYIDTVTVNGTSVTLDSNNQFTLNYADSEQTVVVTDKAGNSTTVTVTIKRHTYRPTVQKPDINVIGSGKVTLSTDGRTADITADEGYELVSITLNGKEIANTDKLTGLKTGDKVVVTFQKKSEEPTVDTKTIAYKVGKMQMTARSGKTAKKNIRITVNTDRETNNLIKELKDLGYTVKYKYYRSTKKSSEYTARIEKDADINSYINTSGKKGTKYYYKVRVMVYDADGNLVAKSDLKQCSYAARTWSK